MNLWKSPGGMARGTLTCADPPEMLCRITAQGFRLSDVEWGGELCVTFSCSGREKSQIADFCRRLGGDIQFSEESGPGQLLRRMIQRPVLAAGAIFLLFLTLYLPTRVLFFEVEGNKTIPARKILAAAEECGIRFGVSRRAVRSEQMKNTLLEAMPELKWAGINTSGCTAVISVRERAMQEETVSDTGVSSIVAARDGFITSCTVTRGNGLCAPGQVVQEGQVLISGYTDCGIVIQVTGAEGEIFADTRREYSAVMPSQCLTWDAESVSSRRFSLKIGKKRINLWKGSGISPATCGRMYEEYYITLPGGFHLPVSLGVETLTTRELVTAQIDPASAQVQLKDFLRKSVLHQMVAGRILHEDQIPGSSSGLYAMEGSFLCSEMIGRLITEEIGETNGKAD